MAAEAINMDVDALLNIAIEKLLSIASALNNDGATSVNYQRVFGVESERVLSKEPLPKAVEASNDEGARASITQQQLSIQKSKVPLFVGYDDLVPGMLVTNPIQSLLFGIERYGTRNVDAISRGVFNVSKALAVRSGKEEDIVMYLEQVLEYLETTPELAGTLLHCHFLYRFAKVFEHEGLMENAKRALYSAQRIAADSSDMAHLEIAISTSLMNIHKELGEDQLLHVARITFIQICEARSIPDGIEYTSVLEAVGRSKFEIGLACSNMEQMGDGINYMTEALRVEADQENETPRQVMRQASLLCNLSECYYQHPELSIGQLACLILLDQAIAGFQQVECTCGPNSIDPLASSWGGTGVIECGRHQALAGAFESLGIVQENQGFMKEAQKSFEQGLDLVEECNDVDRIAEFHFLLANNLFLKSHLNFAFGLPRLEKIPELTKFHYKHIYDHFTEFLKKTRPGASFMRDQLTIYVRALLNPPEDLSEGLLEKVMALQKMLENEEKRGSWSGHAFFHQHLSVHYLRLNDVEACKRHLSLALKSLEETPSTIEISLQVLQPLGWIAMDPEIQDFDCAYGIWQKVYHATTKTLENLAQISEEHAFRYFEISKHACVALAKCQMYREKFSKENKQQLAEGALIWAERGKGRMLMSFIDASTRSNADPASHFDKGRFLTDDTFALKFICNWLPTSPALIMSQARKMVFVEYTFIDYVSLMIQIVIDGPGSVSTLHYSEIISLDNILSEVTRYEAETYLNAVQNSSEAMQNSANTVTFQGEIQNVLSAMNKYSTNRIPFNPWIPGMVVGIQKYMGEAIAKLKRNRDTPVDKEMNKIAELLQGLYAVLIKPIKEKLAAVYEQGRDTLVFVPHEDLGIVPFAALHESENPSRYLIEDYAISVSPSIWCTRHCQYLYEKIVRSGCEEGAVPVLVGKEFGYPPEYPDLRQAHKEVDVVAEAIGQLSSMMVLKDDDLSHARNLMEVLPNASWIHLCVHGEVSSQFPQGSLLFSDNDSQRLTAEEIMTVAPSAWRARAVVLSACQTGLGSVAGGGIMGFARSFILAGVPSSILSMWEADERFSTEFMQKLYKQLASGYTLAYAVQEVIKSMMHKYKKGNDGFKKLKWSSAIRSAPGVVSPWRTAENRYEYFDDTDNIVMWRSLVKIAKPRKSKKPSPSVLQGLNGSAITMNEPCPICFDEQSDKNVRRTCCGYAFHKKCELVAEEWRNFVSYVQRAI